MQLLHVVSEEYDMKTMHYIVTEKAILREVIFIWQNGIF